MEFVIEHSWDSEPVKHNPVRIRFSPGAGGMNTEVYAPFFNDPPAPPGPSGYTFPGLWDYEVVEAFFLNSTRQMYLEVEICPHGQHLVLLLSGVGRVFADQLPLEFKTGIALETWMAEGVIPWSYFPPGVNRMNAYAIHGSGDKRTYEALYPIPKAKLLKGQKPNFHLLEYFEKFRLQNVMGEEWVQPKSDLWKDKL